VEKVVAVAVASCQSESAQEGDLGGVAAIVVAAGRGLRVGGNRPKQYLTVGGETVVRRSLRLFCEHPAIDRVQPVVHTDDQDLFAAAARNLNLLPAVAGGATRQESVFAGLDALRTHRPDIILIHDAARPSASPALVSRATEAARAHGAAVPGLPVADTIKSVDDTGTVTATLDRAALRTVQTPQAFAFQALLAAHERARAAGRNDFTDDAALAEWAGLRVTIFEGEAANVKLTTPDDLLRANATHAGALSDIRTGSGFDVHTFGDGDHVMLGGVRIPHDRGVVGHSDADVALHALTDAVLGAIADGDIGTHFPPSDERWRGASSDRFLAFAAERVRARGGEITLLDTTVLCEAPRVGPHREQIRARIADIAGIGIERVSIKATTMERMGFIGRAEGLAAMATATIRLPELSLGMAP
jgi:2-C-methyl-D-erythritol 4-phosphate cytidylyltransferase / 2-C-methyl-D-erythritol 2,4-cyclodiphosphate synthase